MYINRFIKKFLEIENDPERATEDTYNTVVKKLGAEGFNLKSIEEMKRVRTFAAVFMSSLCGVGVRVRVNNFFSKTTRPRDMLFF